MAAWTLCRFRTSPVRHIRFLSLALITVRLRKRGVGLTSPNHCHGVEMMEDERGYRTPYADDHLKVEHGTTPSDIQDFVLRRATNPIHVGDTTVWDFNNHSPNMEALEKQVTDLMYDRYLIPFQASGVWGYMYHLLPEQLRIVEILAYNQSRGEYIPYPNYLRHSDGRRNDEIREEIAQQFDGMLE